MVYVKNMYNKVQMTLLYKITFLIFNGTYHWNLLIKIPNESPRQALSSYIICYQTHIVF